MSSLDDLLLSELLGAEFREDEDIFKQLGGVDVGNQRSMVHDSDRDNGDEKKEDSRRVSSKAVAVSMPAVEIETKTEKETATVTPVKSVAEPVYVKLKRRVIEEEEEGEGAGESDTLGDLDRFMSLEDLGNRMDELYGDSDGDSDPGSEPTEGPVSAVAKVVKGSDSKNPIKWRNGRLVNDKDRFYGEIRSQAISDSSSEDEVDEDSDDSSSSGSGSEGRKGSDGDSESARSGVKKASKSGSKKVTVELTGVTMKLMLEHLETSIGFDGLFEETNLRCFSEKPSVNSSLKVLRQLPLEWARKKIEYLYIQSKKRQ